MSAAPPDRAFARDLERLTRAARRGRPLSPAAARSLVAAPVAWERWRDAMNALHHAEPATEARLAHALAGAAARRRAPLLRARFTLLEGRGLLRFGSPGDAGDVLAEAARLLGGVGETERAAQALVTAVDALAHAGRLREARALARRAKTRLRGAALAPWRDFLAVNSANVLRLEGDVEGARRAYEAAAGRFEARGDPATATIARMNAAVARLEAGDAEPAHVGFVAAEAAFLAQGRPDMASEARYNAACADVRRGRLGAAVRALEGLAAEHEAAGAARRASLCRMDLADALLRAGDVEAAQAQATRAAAGFEASGAAAEAVEARWLAATALARSDARAGRRSLAGVLRRAGALGRTGLLLRCRLLDADLALRAGRPPKVAQARALARAAAQAGQPEVEAQARLLEARLQLDLRRPRAAQAALGALGRGPRPIWIASAADSLEAEALRAMGRDGRALARLERACARLEPVSADLPGGWLRASFLLEHVDPWLARVDLLLGRAGAGDREAALALLDRLATRRFRALSRIEGGDPRLARLRQRLEALYDRLGRGAGPTRGAGGEETRALAARAKALEVELAAAWRARERRGEAEGRRAGSVARAAEARTATLHVWRHAQRVRVAERTAEGVARVWEAGDAGGLAVDLERLAFHARRSLVAEATRAPAPPEPRPAPAPPPSAPSAAFARQLDSLAARLLGPLRTAGLPERLALTVDPTLPDIPFEVLPVRGAPLASRTRLVRVPSVEVAPLPRPGGHGVAWVACGEADLPGLEREGAALASTSSLVVGERATRAALRRALETCERVHVAGHGFDAQACPALGGVRLADGWFGAVDLPERVAADVVVLAACRTGRARGTGALAWGGLPAALLSLGARHVLWTADDVDDAATASLGARLDAALRSGDDVPTAFGRALLEATREAGSAAALLPFRLSGILP